MTSRARYMAVSCVLWSSAAFAQPTTMPTTMPTTRMTPATQTKPHARADELFARSGIADWTQPPAPTREPSIELPSAKRVQLPNGIALLVVENHQLPIVSMTLLAPGAGAAADPQGKGGLAAYTADLLDEGAAGLSAIAIAEEQARLGADIDVDIDMDAALVSVRALSATLEPTLDLLTQIVTQPNFHVRDAERIKGDRITSLAQRRDRPREVASLVLNAALFGISSPYGHPAAGVSSEFAKLHADDAKQFYREHWTPATMTLVVAGDIDSDKLATKLRSGLGTWNTATDSRTTRTVLPPAAAALQPSSRLLWVDRSAAAQSDVRVGLVGLPRKDPRYFAFEVFRTILGDGFTSRLVQRLREQLGITYGAGADMHWLQSSAGPFVISTAIESPETSQGISEIIKIVSDLDTNEVSAAELDKAKQNLIRALPAQFETNSGTADAFADLALYGQPDDWFRHYADGIRKVSAADVKAVARSLVPAARLVFSVVGDLAKLRSSLDALGLGAPVLHDVDGKPIATPAK